jgi:O-acetyl-ADP-ribose deacetylase (regulator of RNase III)
VFGFPQREAAEIAVGTVNEYKERTQSRIKVIFNVFKDDDFEIYRKLLS